MHNSKLKQITVALCLALLPLSVFAAGLGKLNVRSGLGEPLKADIELLSVNSEDLSSVVATIASDEAYTVQGIEKPASHNTIKVEIGKNANGAPILKLKSSQPISEPFLDMLIQVDWASGRLLREYTVLLDPPGYTGETPDNVNSQSNQAPLIKPSNAANNSPITNPINSVRKSQPRIGNKSAQAQQAIENEALQEDIAQNYKTQRGDSLAVIAQRMKPEGISLDQMLVGLYQANPDAFDANNMNRLKVGKILRQPSEQELSVTSRQFASKEVKMQAADWNAYRNKLAGIVARSAPSNIDENAQSAGGKVTSAAQDQSQPINSGAKDVVKLSAGENRTSKLGGPEDAKTLQAKITSLQEENIAHEKSVIEAQARTAALEKQIEEMQKLLTIKNMAMADLQNQSVKDSSASKNAPIDIDSANANKGLPVATPETMPKITPSEVAVIKPVKDLKPAEDITAPAVSESNFSLLDDLDLPLLGSVVGILALLGAAWMFLRNKRRLNLANFEQGIMTSGGLKANTVFGNTSGSKVDTGDTSFLTDFSQSAHGGMIDTNDVDPIAEAEVYMAYGRDAQAEEILKDAITKEPKRYELHLKLLEMYATSKNFSAFETVAGELYTTLGADDPTWAKVVEIGSKLEPSNPLYQVKITPENINSPDSASATPLDADDFSGVPIAVETDLDFSFDNDSLVQDFASASTSTLIPNNLSESQSDQLLEFNVESVSNKSTPLVDNVISADHGANSKIAPDSIELDTTQADNLDFDFGEFETNSTHQTSDITANNADNSLMQDINMGAFEISKQEDLPSPLTEVSAKPVDIDFNEMHDYFNNDQQNRDLESQEPLVTGNDIYELSPNAGIPTLNHNGAFNGIETVDEKLSFDGLETNEPHPDHNLVANTSEEEASIVSKDKMDVAKSFDFSSISLDLNDKDAEPLSNEMESLDPIEIETKLSLVLAYIEMDDLEGAKEMLDEVMNEGSENQRKRAQEIATTLV